MDNWDPDPKVIYLSSPSLPDADDLSGVLSVLHLCSAEVSHSLRTHGALKYNK